MTRPALLVWITYARTIPSRLSPLLTSFLQAFDYWGFTITGSFLPKPFLARNSAIDISTATPYGKFVIIYICGIPSIMLGALIYGVPGVARKWAITCSSALMGFTLFLFATANTEASNIGLDAMENLFESMFNAGLYGWTPEAFPAPIRGTAAGVASFWGRLPSIVSPLIAADLLVRSLNAPI